MRSTGRGTGQGLAIDLGSTTMRVLPRRAEHVLRLPTVAALDLEGRIFARGDRALTLEGRRTDALRLVRPVARRAVADAALAGQLLRWALTEATGRRARRLPGATVCVPDGTGELQTRALLDVCHAAGLRQVRLVSKSLASAAGAGIPLREPFGALVVDVGAERTDAALLSFGDLIATRGATIGGADIDAGVIQLLRHRHGLTICAAEAERAKLRVADAAATGATVPVQGQDLQRGLPDSREIPADELARVPRATYDGIADLVRELLADSPPKLVDDVYERGLLLCGEGARLHGLADHLRERVDLPVHVPDAPGDVGVRGAWHVTV